MPTVPPYITKCVHLSIYATSDSGVEGGVKKLNTNISATQSNVNGKKCRNLIFFITKAGAKIKHNYHVAYLPIIIIWVKHFCPIAAHGPLSAKQN